MYFILPNYSAACWWSFLNKAFYILHHGSFLFFLSMREPLWTFYLLESHLYTRIWESIGITNGNHPVKPARSTWRRDCERDILCWVPLYGVVVFGEWGSEGGALKSQELPESTQVTKLFGILDLNKFFILWTTITNYWFPLHLIWSHYVHLIIICNVWVTHFLCMLIYVCSLCTGAECLDYFGLFWIIFAVEQL